MKTITLMLSLFLFFNTLTSIEMLKMRGSTDPLEKALERALYKIFTNAPERIDVTLSEVAAFDISLERKIFEHFENILTDVGFVTLDRNNHVFSRNRYNDNSKVNHFIIIVKATDKQIYMVALDTDAKTTYGYATERF